MSGPISTPDHEHAWTLMTVHKDGDTTVWKVYVENNYSRTYRDNYSREFHNNELPDVIKQKLAFIHAVSGSAPVEPDNPHISFSDFVCDRTKVPESLLDVGWRVTENKYCLLLESAFLMKLRGERDAQR